MDSFWPNPWFTRKQNDLILGYSKYIVYFQNKNV